MPNEVSPRTDAAPPHPWGPFLGEIDQRLTQTTQLQCLGVGIVTPPCDYADRMQRMFPGAPWRHLRLFALDATDLALSKLERNIDRDREDFQLLFRAGLIDAAVLEKRYHEELRPYLLSNLDWHDKTLSLWLAIAKSIQG